jgi:hypothetical protein
VAILIFVSVVRNRSIDSQTDLIEALWRPIYQARERVTICVPMSLDGAAGESMDMEDGLTVARLTGPIEEKRKPFEIISTAEMSRLRAVKSPRILIGTSIYLWPQSITSGLRYSFDTDRAAHTLAIRDNRSGDTICRPVSDFNSQAATDCALAARVQNAASGGVTIIAVGLHGAGTIAAGEFLIERNYFSQIAKRLPRGWETRNLAVVLSTAIVGGDAGPPHVLAMDVW